MVWAICPQILAEWESAGYGILKLSRLGTASVYHHDEVSAAIARVGTLKYHRLAIADIHKGQFHGLIHLLHSLT